MDRGSDPICCVDDDAYRRSLVRLLKSGDYCVKSFAPKQSFHETVPVAHKAGVLVLDVRMPGMNGFDLHQKLNGLFSKLSIIMTTAGAYQSDSERALYAGDIGFPQKPFEDKSLL